MLALKAFVQFHSTMSLDDVAKLISAHLFGALPFLATDEFDEEPGMRLSQECLGFVPTICGAGPEYVLRLMTTPSHLVNGDSTGFDIVYLDRYLEERLMQLEGITIIPT
jgi:hypothetical protein